MVKIAPSILSADFACLGDEVRDVLSGGADYIHFDVMDGVFVPNISFGIPVLKSLRKVSDAFLDVHLMIDRPIRYVEKFCDAGADLVNIHVEADGPDNTLKALQLIRAKGKKTGLTLKPGTGAEAVLPYLPYIDLVLIMTVEPGFGGQSFMHEMLDKVRTVAGYINDAGVHCEIEADGGINNVTAPLLTEAGCNVLVAGSYVFDKADRAAAISSIKNI